jgi:SNF2 family DNA or RNA helicase
MGWFDVCLDYEDAQGNSIPSSEIQRAFLKGDAFLDRGETIFLLDSEAIASMQEVFEDCAAGEGRAAGSFRLPGVYAPYVKSSLDSIDGIDVEANAGWLQRADRQNKLATADPMPIPDSVTAVLRPYQIAGVHWLGFLDRHAFGGILADEMGLGKTLQTLTWLQSRRQQENGNRSPALIVCPTSLVENWAEEAARFTPHQDVLVISGAKRDTAFHRLCEADLVITSYALLRRDLERYAPFSFSAMVLDEAQHIKNHSTRNAKAAKAVRAERRLVLTGTPIENSVSDLWSIMDFLMPGYLGDHPSFRDRYEVPIARGDRQSESALARLRRKLNPFLLRRLKRDVARELPPKIERVARFHLSPDQQQVYQEVLRESQHRLTDLVARRGFQRSRMQILSTLLRLRQICCHVDLLKIPGLNVERPSAKLELFFELLDEALDGGHRMLVFSQFVSMLTILREQLEQRGVAYSYLDGGTTQRQNEVNRFNRQADIPVFLISLKAGGTGLNLTGADMVVHFDPWWNPAVEAQATDRAYRIGQLRTVYSLKLIARNSVEEEVLALQAKKRAVIDAALSSDQAFLEQLDWDDIRTLLNM